MITGLTPAIAQAAPSGADVTALKSVPFLTSGITGTWRHLLPVHCRLTYSVAQFRQVAYSPTTNAVPCGPAAMASRVPHPLCSGMETDRQAESIQPQIFGLIQALAVDST